MFRIVLIILTVLFSTALAAHCELESKELSIPEGHDEFSWHSQLWIVNSYSSQEKRNKFGDRIKIYYDVLLPAHEVKDSVFRDLKSSGYKFEHGSNVDLDGFVFYSMFSKEVINETDHIARDQLIIFEIGERYNADVSWFLTES